LKGTGIFATVPILTTVFELRELFYIFRLLKNFKVSLRGGGSEKGKIKPLLCGLANRFR
jgi:hypothetical protein